MPRYQYDISLSRQKRFIRHFKQFLVALVVLGLLAGSYLVFDALKQDKRNNTQTGKAVTTTYRPSVREFDTAYFSFTTPTSWKNITEETTNQKYVYRSFRGTLVENELIIYVNAPNADLQATRVLPVRIDTEQNIIPSQTSEHCNTYSNQKRASQPVELTVETVKILCLLDGTNYVTVVGQKNGTTNLLLERTNGQTANYNFIYRSSMVPPDALPLVNIINTFTAH